MYARTLSRAKTIRCSSTKHSLEGQQNQYERLDEAIRTGRFVRNSIIRAGMDGQVKSRNDAYIYCKIVADNPEFPWARLLNSQTRQAHPEKAWASIESFLKNAAHKLKGRRDSLSSKNITLEHQ